MWVLVCAYMWTPEDKLRYSWDSVHLSFETENKQSKLGWLVSPQHQENKHLTLGLDFFFLFF